MWCGRSTACSSPAGSASPARPRSRSSGCAASTRSPRFRPGPCSQARPAKWSAAWPTRLTHQRLGLGRRPGDVGGTAATPRAAPGRWCVAIEGLGKRGRCAPPGNELGRAFRASRTLDHVGEPVMTVQAEDQPSWAEVVRRAESGETVSIIVHGEPVADVVPSGELARLRETVEVLSDPQLVRDLRDALADAQTGRVFTAGQVAADLAARRAAGE